MLLAAMAIVMLYHLFSMQMGQQVQVTNLKLVGLYQLPDYCTAHACQHLRGPATSFVAVLAGCQVTAVCGRCHDCAGVSLVLGQWNNLSGLGVNRS